MSIPNISSVFAQLYNRYRKSGMSVLGGFSPYLCDNIPSARGNFIKKDNTILSSSAGISNDEAFFMHGLCEQIVPKNILIIGNSYGFSTVFLALSNPKSNLLAFDKFRTEGIKVTNNVLKGLKNKLVVQGSTPDDIIPLINNHFKNQKLDFVLIDAVHTNEMQTKEFDILKNYLSDESVVVFHDVILCNLLDSYNYLKENNTDLTFRLINKTATGIGVCLKGKLSEEMNSFLDYFSSAEEEIFNFLTLMFKKNTLSSQNLFDNVRTNLKFLPHPQK